MTKPTILITGANGEVGHGLIRKLGEQDYPLLAIDMRPIDESLAPYLRRTWVGDILDNALLSHIFDAYNIDIIFHMAAILSTTAEQQPVLAHQVNVQGTLNLLELAQASAQHRDTRLKFIFPSSIAVYGLPDVSTKLAAAAVDENSY